MTIGEPDLRIKTTWDKMDSIFANVERATNYLNVDWDSWKKWPDYMKDYRFWYPADDKCEDYGTLSTRGSYYYTWPPYTVSEDEKQIMITMEVAGATKEDIELELNKKTNYLGAKIEAKRGRFQHYAEPCLYLLPAAHLIDEDKICATCKDGLLEIVIPKTPPAPKEEDARKIPVE